MAPRRFFVILLIYLICLVVYVQADTLKLQNGDVISGTIVTMDEESVTIKTVYGVVTVDRSFITEGSFSGSSILPRDGLLLELTFDSGFRDTSGLGRSVENPSRVALQPHEGTDGNLYFDSLGDGQYVSVRDDGTFGELAKFTVAFDVMIRNAEKSQYIVSKWNQASGTTADGKFALNYRSGTLSLYVVDADGSYHLFQHNQAFPANRWMYVVLVFSEDRVAIYLNGTLALEDTDTVEGLFVDENPIYLMTAPSATSDRYTFYNADGGIDNFRVYGRVLSVDEIEALHTGITN